MPMSAARPCVTCGQVACKAHVREVWRSPHRPPPTRVRGRKLQKLRKQLYQREQNCRVCGVFLLPHQMIRDHVIPLIDGGADDSSNEQAICESCHALKTQKEALRGRSR